MKIKTVLYLLRDKPENLPPSISQMLMLCQLGCRVQVVTMQASAYLRRLFSTEDVEFIAFEREEKNHKNRLDKVTDLLAYRNLVKKALQNCKYDLLWLGSADTAMYCKDLLPKQVRTVLNIYELYDRHPNVLRAIKPVAQQACGVVVPEYNRAHILKVWLGLKETPTVIPNKPCFPHVQILPETQRILEQLREMKKKIVLYQGWIGKDRDVTNIARALARLENKEEYALVLMGSVSSEETIRTLQSQYSNTVHIPFLQPPQHLFVTKLAYMGIATYDDSSLNQIFCAPNKIYEYASMQVPILARDIPGLSNTVGMYGAGVCVDMNSVEAITDAIKTLDNSHAQYVQGLDGLLNAHDVKATIAKILKSCEERLG